MADAFDDLREFLARDAKAHPRPKREPRLPASTEDATPQQKKALLQRLMSTPEMDAEYFKYWFTHGGREMFPLSHWREQIRLMILNEEARKANGKTS